jgi:hypothetical protein
MNENEKQGGKAAAQGRQMPDTAQQAAQEEHGGLRRLPMRQPKLGSRL